MKKRKAYMERSFAERYKDVKKGFILGICVGIMFLSVGVSQMFTNAIDVPSIGYVITGFCFIFYISILFLLYWKFNKYHQKQQPVPERLRIISGIFLVFSLAFDQLYEKNQRRYLVLKEWRRHILSFIFLNILVGIFAIYALMQGWIFWAWFNFLIVAVYWMISLVVMFFIWKYHGTNNKVLLFLTIITLDYANYRFYKNIIALNESSAKDSVEK